MSKDIFASDIHAASIFVAGVWRGGGGSEVLVSSTGTGYLDADVQDEWVLSNADNPCLCSPNFRVRNGLIEERV